MKVKPAKRGGKVLLKIDPITEPRITQAFLESLQRLRAARIRKILATTDFSDLSLEGVQYAIALAREFNAALTLVNVVEPTVYLGGMESVVIGQDDESIVKIEKRHLATLAKKLSKPGRPVQAVVRYGKAFREIAGLAEEQKSDLIVTTTHGYTGLKRVLIGSTAEWVVRYAPCPVLAIPSQTADHKSGRSWTEGIRHIIVPIDFSETSTKAVSYAAALAEKFKARVTLVHVTAAPTSAGLDYIPSATIQNSIVRSAEELLLRVQREAFPAWIETKATVLSGTPYHEITRAALRAKADLIILTTHGRTGFQHAFLGSTAERVVRHSPCPVLVVRDKAAPAAG